MPQAAIAAVVAIGSAISGAAAAFVPALVGTFGIASQISAGLILAGGLEAFSIVTTPRIGQTAAGTQVDFQADPAGPVPYAIGRTGTAGTIVLQDVTGQHNKYLHTLTVLSGAGPVHSIGGFTANDEPVSFTADAGEGATGRYANRMWWKYRLGEPDGQAIAWSATAGKDVPATHGGTPLPIAFGQLSGLAATLWALEYDAAIYPTGVPKPLNVVEGVRVYDPRLDSTYPGGAGLQRAADEASWAYSQNPYLHALTWCLGRTENGRETLGLHVPPAAIDMAAFVEGANVADSHGWTLGGVIYSTDAKIDVLRAMLAAGSGRPIPLAAKISCVVNAPRVSLDILRGADVVGDASVAAIQSARSAPNTIWPRYREEAQGWQIVPTAAPVAVPAYYDADGGKRSKEVEYTLCQSADQAATLARYDIENAREFGPIVLPCKPRWMGYRPGDAITVDEPELGLNSQKCLITGRSVDPASMVVTLTLRSETDGKHAFALGETADPPSIPGLTGVDVISIPAPASDAWAITGTSVTGADGEILPAIVVEGETDNVNVAQIRLEHRVEPLGGAAGEWTEGALSPANAVRLVDTGVAAGVRYGVRISYITVRGVPSTPLSLGSVTAGALLAGDTLHVATRPSQQVLDAIDAAHALIQAVDAANGQLATAQTALDATAAQLASQLKQFGFGADLNAYALIDAALTDAGEKAVRDFLGRDIDTGVQLRETVQRHTVENETTSTNFDFLGQRNAAGTAFILDFDKVQADPDGTTFAQRLAALNAQTGASVLATATQMFSTKTTTDYAVASLTQQLVAQDAAVRSTLQTSYITIATSQASSAALENRVTAAYGNAIASSASTLIQAYAAADATLAQRVDTVQASFGPMLSALSSSITSAYANADLALAGRIDSVSAAAGDAKASATITASALATLSGQIVGSLVFKASASDNQGRQVISQMQLIAAGGATPTSAVIFDTSSVLFRDPGDNTGKNIFSWSAGKLYSPYLVAQTANIDTLSVNTANIANGALTQPFNFRSSEGRGASAAGAGCVVLTRYVTTSAPSETLQFIAGGAISNFNTLDADALVTVYFDGAGQITTPWRAFAGTQTSSPPQPVVVGGVTPGTHEIRVAVACPAVGSGVTAGDAIVTGVRFLK